MSDRPKARATEIAISATSTPDGKFKQWLEDPMGQVIIASVATMSTLGIVLCSIWAINIAIN